MDKYGDFLAKDYLGRSIDSKELKGKKIWLAFYRYASCPLCNLHIHNILNNWSYFEKKVIFLPVFQSSSREIKKYVGKNSVPFTIIADPDEKLYKKFDVKKSYKGFFSISMVINFFKAIIRGHFPGKIQGSFSRLPKEFLINEKGKILFSYEGKHIGDHPDLELIIGKLAKIQGSQGKESE